MHEDTERPVYKKVQMAESDQNQKNIGKTKNRETKKTIFRESCLGPPHPKSLEMCLFFVFIRFLASVGHFKETGMNHRQSCQSAFGSGECSKTCQNIILNNGKTALPGAAVLFF